MGYQKKYASKNKDVRIDSVKGNMIKFAKVKSNGKRGKKKNPMTKDTFLEKYEFKKGSRSTETNNIILIFYCPEKKSQVAKMLTTARDWKSWGEMFADYF